MLMEVSPCFVRCANVIQCAWPHYKGMEVQLAGTYSAWKRAAKCSDVLRWFWSHWIYQQGLKWIEYISESIRINLFWEAKERLSCPNSLPSSWHHQGEAKVLSAKSWGYFLCNIFTASISKHVWSGSERRSNWWMMTDDGFCHVPPASPDSKVRLAAATKVYCIVRGQDSSVPCGSQIWFDMTTIFNHGTVFNQWLVEIRRYLRLHC